MGCLKISYQSKITVIDEKQIFVDFGYEKNARTKNICSNYYSFGMLQPGRNGGEYRYGYQGSEADDEIKGKGNSYTTYFRQLDPRLGRWLSIDPKATAWESPYVSMGNNPVIKNDVLGDTARAYNRRSARRMMRTIKKTFKGKEFKEFRQLVKRKGKTFDAIDEGDFDFSMRDLNNDERALAEGYMTLFNAREVHVVDMVRRGEKLTSYGSVGDKDGDGKITGNDADLSYGGGVNTRTLSGTLSIIVMNSNVAIGDFKDKSGASVSGQYSSPGELLAHEALGHGLTRFNAGGQWKNAILLTNLYRRVIDSEYWRDGSYHGGRGYLPYLRVGNSNELPLYLGRSLERKNNMSRGRILFRKGKSTVIKY